jgi:SprT-like family
MSKPYLCQGRTANECYDLLNRLHFRGKLPKIPVRWPRPPKGKRWHWLGRTFIQDGVATEIHLNPEYCAAPTIWSQTLLHEMVHVEQAHIPLRYKHGPRFQARMLQLAKKGAFKYIW